MVERKVSPVPAVRSASRNSVHTARKAHGRTVHELPDSPQGCKLLKGMT